MRALPRPHDKGKGKGERGVGYAERNAVAGHRFGSWAEMEARLARWTR